MVKNMTIFSALMPLIKNSHEKMHLAEISRDMDMPHTTMRCWLNELHDDNVLKRSIRGRQTLYELNMENSLIKDYLVMAEKEQMIIKAENSKAIKDVAAVLKEENVRSAIIYGGADKPRCRIKILVEGRVRGIRERCSAKIKNVLSLTSINSTLKEEIIKDHIIITGTERAVAWMIGEGIKR